MRSRPTRMRSFFSIRRDGMFSKKLPIPDNITLLPLPPKSPELNPVENIWQTVARFRQQSRVQLSGRAVLGLHPNNDHEPEAAMLRNRMAYFSFFAKT